MTPPTQGVQDREVLARLESISARVTAIGADAREARDGVHEIKTTMREQNLGERIQSAVDQIKAAEVAFRSDLANTTDRIKAEMRDSFKERDAKIEAHAARLDKLEDTHTSAAGSLTVIGWIANRSPWLVSIVGGLVWAYSWLKGHHT